MIVIKAADGFVADESLAIDSDDLFSDRVARGLKEGQIDGHTEIQISRTSGHWDDKGYRGGQPAMKRRSNDDAGTA